MAFTFAGCCHPVPGDEIVGIVTTGKGVTIHGRGMPDPDRFRRDAGALHRRRLELRSGRQAGQPEDRRPHRPDQRDRRPMSRVRWPTSPTPSPSRKAPSPTSRSSTASRISWRSWWMSTCATSPIFESDRRAARPEDDQRRRAGHRRMILGIGSDICDIRRIEKAIERHGAASSNACSPKPSERRRCGGPRRSRPPPSPNGSPPRKPPPRPSGTGFRNGVFFSDLGVVNLPGGQPTLADDRRIGRTPARDHAGRYDRSGRI